MTDQAAAYYMGPELPGIRLKQEDTTGCLDTKPPFLRDLSLFPSKPPAVPPAPSSGLCHHVPQALLPAPQLPQSLLLRPPCPLLRPVPSCTSSASTCTTAASIMIQPGSCSPASTSLGRWGGGGGVLVYGGGTKSRKRGTPIMRPRGKGAAPSTPPNPKPFISQIEEAYIGAEDFCRKLQQDPKAVLNNEVLLLQVCEGGGSYGEGRGAACGGGRRPGVQVKGRERTRCISILCFTEIASQRAAKFSCSTPRPPSRVCALTSSSTPPTGPWRASSRTSGPAGSAAKGRGRGPRAQSLPAPLPRSMRGCWRPRMSHSTAGGLRLPQPWMRSWSATHRCRWRERGGTPLLPVRVGERWRAGGGGGSGGVRLEGCGWRAER